MNVWLVSPAWRRVEVTRLALAERRWLCDELAARGHAANSVIVADDENLEIAEEYGFHTVRMGNEDVGAKFNAGYAYAAEQGADVFVHVGSDDWVHPDVFSILDTVDIASVPEGAMPEPGAGAVVWRRGPLVVSQRKATVVDLLTGEVRRCAVAGSRGCIPWLIPRSAMAGCRFRPIQPGKQRGLDGALARGLKARPNWIYQDAGDDWLVDFKSDVNITPFRPLVENLGHGEPVGLAALVESYPAWLVELARDTHERLMEG